MLALPYMPQKDYQGAAGAQARGRESTGQATSKPGRGQMDKQEKGGLNDRANREATCADK